MQVCGKESGTDIVKGAKSFTLTFAFSRAIPNSDAHT